MLSTNFNADPFAPPNVCCMPFQPCNSPEHAYNAHNYNHNDLNDGCSSSTAGFASNNISTSRIDQNGVYVRLVTTSLGTLPPVVTRECDSQFPGVVFAIPCHNKEHLKLDFNKWCLPGVAIVCGEDRLVQEVTFCYCSAEGNAVQRTVELMSTFQGGCAGIKCIECDHVKLIQTMIEDSNCSLESIMAEVPRLMLFMVSIHELY
jgi:hypothetical protein